MKHLAFVTCEDLSPYFPSDKEPLLTHDDYVAAEYLRKKGFKVTPLIWGESPKKIQKAHFDCLLVRSPWDYMDTEEKRQNFLKWLKQLKETGLKVLNPIDVMLWSLDKHYLHDFYKVGVQTVPSLFLEPEATIDLRRHYEKGGAFVLKPCVSAAAKDTYRFLRKEDVENFLKEDLFQNLRDSRSFILQPYLNEIESSGEWSLIFIGGEYSHGVLKKPKKGNWLVQDELGGSVHWVPVPEKVKKRAIEIFKKIPEAFQESQAQEKNTSHDFPLAYARVDLIEQNQELYMSEVELIEPELFFLDRRTTPPGPHLGALEKIHSYLQKIF